MSKIYKTAPLPFQGQKRRFVNEFTLAIKELMEKQEIKIVVDLFGGSGLLSHTVKCLYPDCRVIYNDYDNYSFRLRNIGATNRLLSDIRVLLADCPREKKLTDSHKNSIVSLIEKENDKGYVDYITLSSSLLFSSQYRTDLNELRKEPFYNRVKASGYDFDADEYLRGLEIVCVDYQLLYKQYKDVPGVLFLVDLAVS